MESHCFIAGDLGPAWGSLATPNVARWKRSRVSSTFLRYGSFGSPGPAPRSRVLLPGSPNVSPRAFPRYKRLLQVVSVPVGALPERFVDCEIEQHPVERRVVPDNLRYMSS